MIPIIPEEVLSALAIIGSILCLFAFRKIPKMTRTSLVTMFQIGMMFFGPLCLMIGFLYAYFGVTEPLEPIRQSLVRILFVYLFTGVNIWSLLILWKGRNL